MKYKNRFTETQWLELLKSAIDEGVAIQVNHRFTYKNKNLGTFLTSAKSKNKTELMEKIEALGLSYRMHSKDPEVYLEKFIHGLWTDVKPIKQRYDTRFNLYIRNKKDILKKEIIEELNTVWGLKFGVVRNWDKLITLEDRVQRWKDFRYDEKINPDRKWFMYRSNMGNLYNWVYIRKRDTDKMEPLQKYFSTKELRELAKEGF